MITVNVGVDTDAIERLRRAAKQAPSRMRRVVASVVRENKSQIIADLRGREPGPPSYPIRWKSERQRRAFFATNGFGGGIPYRRTGTLSNGWFVDVTTDNRGGSIAIGNDVPYARFVVGADQQPFHEDTGWPQVTTRTQIAIQEQLEDELIDGWYEIATNAEVRV